MKVTYEIKISIDTGALLPPVGDLLKKVNSEMTSLGYEEQLMCRSKIIAATITSEGEMTKEQIENVKTMMIEQFSESHPEWKARIESFRRQSGNVQLSVS